MKFQRYLVAFFLLGGMALLLGCGSMEAKLLSDFRSLNDTNVAKVRTCFEIFSSRNNFQSPKDQAELLAFLQSGHVDKNLERLGVSPSEIEDIFVSERDGEPLKIKWGIKMNPDKPLPIAFESVGVNGVRLVAADVLLEIDNDEEYDRLWEGEYESANDILKKKSEGLEPE